MKKLLSILFLLLWATPAFSDSSTTHYSFIQPQNGGSQNVWGSKLNSNFANIDSNLWLASLGTVVGVNSPAASGSSIILTNPLNNVQLIQFSSSSLKLILPAMNASNSMVVGGSIRISNVGSNTFSIVAQDGTTAVVSSLTSGSTVIVSLTANSTANGTFESYAVVPASGGGTPFLVSNNLSEGVPATMRTNLGLGTAATTNLSSVIINSSGLTIGSGQITSAMLGTVALPNGSTATTQSAGDNTTKIATDAFVLANATSLNSPHFTGIPTAPTAATGTSTTQLATTAFVIPTASTIGSNGARYNPDGTIDEWGSIPGSVGTISVSFPVTFPNNCFSVVFSYVGPDGGSDLNLTANPTTGGFSVANASTSVTRIFWRAIGN